MEKIKNIMKSIRKKPILSFFVILVFVVAIGGVGYAAWALFLQAEFTGLVVSDEGALFFQTTFSDFVLNTSNSSDNITQEILVSNNNGIYNFSLDINITKVDAYSLDDCEDWINDCNITYSYENELIEHGDNIVIAPGISTIKARIDCVKNSCPQNLSSSIKLI